LQIPAFGPFTNLDLEFDRTPGDLHVVYGPNEAGKSSLLRAIGDLLFGIPGQSPDNFLHDYSELRIRCTVENKAGQQLDFQRRKGNRNTLLDGAGQALPDTALSPFLGGIDRAYFAAMFGLGSRELREGARQILEGEGEVGAALFSASLGGTPIQRVLKALREEADLLFKGRATTRVTIRPESSRHKDLLRQSREVVVDPEHWRQLEREIEAAASAKAAQAARVAEIENTAQWLIRCQDALPTVGRLDAARVELGQLGTLPEVAGDFIARAREARDRLAAERSQVQRLELQSARLRARLAEVPAKPPVLDHADAVEALHQDLGGYREQRKTLARLQSSMAALDLAIQSGMKDLELDGGIDSLEARRLGSPALLAFREAAARLTAARQEQAAGAGKAAELGTAIATCERQLQRLPVADLTGLREALAIAAETTDADRTLATGQAEVQRLLRETAQAHSLLPGAPADYDAAARLPIPSGSTIRRFQEQMEKAGLEVRDHERKAADARAQASLIRAELSRLQRQGELPSVDALRQARAHRDHGWELVLAAWKQGAAGEGFVPGTPLEEAYPQAVARADAVADQLRLEAEAVALAEEKRLQLTEAERSGDAATAQAGVARTALESIQASWQREWSAAGLVPRSPSEMQDWRESWRAFREALGKLTSAQESLERKADQIKRATQRLAAALDQPADKPFSVLFEAARRRVQAGEESRGRRREIGDRLEEHREGLARHRLDEPRLDAAVADALETWKRQCVAVGLDPGFSPETGEALLRRRIELVAKYDVWREQSLASNAAGTAVADYAAAIGARAAALGLGPQPVETAEAALWAELTRARTTEARRLEWAEQLDAVHADLERARADAALAAQALNDLVRRADLESPDGLESLLARLEEHQRLTAQIDSLRRTLNDLARGQTVDAFVARVRAEDAGSIARRIAEASERKTEGERALKTFEETLFKLETQKRSFEQAGDAAADFRQQAELCAARLKRDGARFLRLRLATHLLEVQIERFRKENQGPLLERSGAIFRELTRGAFAGLDAECSDLDQPVLVALRPGHRKVPVEGLSDGTRDQLYLALRLAALARHADEHEPMPFILDDLLITFDDARAQAVLEQLATLATRCQILLFTHHQHLVQLCRQSLGNDPFHLHEPTL
jgi:uncharacterized protein YhaN